MKILKQLAGEDTIERKLTLKIKKYYSLKYLKKTKILKNENTNLKNNYPELKDLGDFG